MGATAPFRQRAGTIAEPSACYHRFRYQIRRYSLLENIDYLTHTLAELRHDFFTTARQGRSRRAAGLAQLAWGGTHAPANGRTCGCSHLRFDRRVREYRQCRVTQAHPVDDSAP